MSNQEKTGGISSADYVFADEVSAVTFSDSGVKITLNSGATWRPIYFKLKGFDPSSAPSTDERGTLYSNSVAINLAVPVSEANIKNYVNIQRRGILVRYKMFSGETYLLGSEAYPLRGTLQRSTPKDIAAARSARLTLAGMIPFEQPMFVL